MSRHRSLIVIQVTRVDAQKPAEWEKEEGKAVYDLYYNPQTVKGIGTGVNWAEAVESQGGGIGGPWIHVRGVPSSLVVKPGQWVVLSTQGHFESNSDLEPFFRI